MPELPSGFQMHAQKIEEVCTFVCTHTYTHTDTQIYTETFTHNTLENSRNVSENCLSQENPTKKWHFR